MTGKTHQIVGITAGLSYFIIASSPTYNPSTLGAVLAFSYLGALLPDIDTETGKIWHLIPFGHTVGKIADPFLEHRNISHSILGLGLVGVGAFFLLRLFPSYWGIDFLTVFIATLISYASHIFADLFTVEGTPLLFPYGRFFGIPPKPFDGLRIVTGKWFENFIIFPSVNIILILLIILNWNKFHLILFK